MLYNILTERSSFHDTEIIYYLDLTYYFSVHYVEHFYIQIVKMEALKCTIIYLSFLSPFLGAQSL